MSETIGGKRTYLKDILPLEMPIMLQMFPVYACNFKCEFCIHALDKDQHGYISYEVFMDMELYKKAINDIKATGIKLKMLRFAAIGEPLLHKNIADMIKYAVDMEVADSVDIVTNASLLTRELSDALIDAKLSRLRISIEGLSSEDYKERCSNSVDFNKLVENIQYFYKNKTNTTVYVKIIDYMLKDDEQHKKFHEIFEPICDSIAIEHLTPTIEEIDYDTISDGMDLDKGQNSDTLLDARVCPQGFYMMQINPDGKVVPCCNMKYPAVLGDIKENTVQEVWKGEEFNEFRRNSLCSRATASGVCASCTLYKYGMHKEDNIDDVSTELKEKYK